MFLDRNAFRKIGLGLGAATEVVVYTMSGFAIGYYLDKHLIKVTEPWLMVFFTLAGMVGGFVRLFVIFKKFDEPTDEK